LTFDNEELSKRNSEFLAAGATSDFSSYIPHITLGHISKIPFTPDDLDVGGFYFLSATLGPEIFEELD
jgi:hypothetical protein